MSHKPIDCHTIGLSFPQKVCFDGLTTQIHYGSRIAIMGQNGSGKSTLLKMLQGLVEPSQGEISVPNDMTFGYVPQVIEEFESLSGGQRLNEALTQALALDPSVLLLDEPTNHLDLRNRRSLMRMLRNYPGTLIIVSHDVELLRNCVDTLWHIENGKVHIFSGNYDDYVSEIAIKRASLEEEYARLDRQKKETHQALMKEQTRAKNSRERGEKHIKQRKWPTIVSDAKARRAVETAGRKKRAISQTKQGLTDRLSELRVPEIIKPKFSLSGAESGSKTLVSIQDGTCGYGTPLLQGINLSVGSHERIAITGDNGSGKSTLVKAILHHPVVIKSGYWFGPKPNDIGYLDQHYSTLDPHKTVLETIQNVVSTWTHGDIRRHLNDFLFRKNEEINAPVHTLSGGEKARLSLAQIAAKTPKLLILDEITNNLDLETREHVIQVLQNYPGAIIVISHDEGFLQAISIENFYIINKLHHKLPENQNMKHSQYEDVNEVLHSLTQGMAKILGDNLVGIYLTGSLSYGDFNPDNSDIDLVAILHKPASQKQLTALEQMHLMVGIDHEKWAKRIECSYTPMDMLPSIQPPKTPRPYFGEGIFYVQAPYGNEWIINQYLLYKHGIPLRGPDFKTLITPIDIEDVREACIRDLFEEWEPKINDPEWFNNSHYQSYIVLNLCRILYTVVCHSMASKKASAAWVKREFGPHWYNLIETAEDWDYGKEMNLQEEVLEFIKFVVSKVKDLIMTQKIEIVPYNPAWPQMFEEEAAKIKQALGENFLAVHHIGSTAVPGLWAKPKIDIIAVVKDMVHIIQDLEKTGYEYRGEFNIPLHLGFRKRPPLPNVNLHVFEEGNPEIELNLLFRDYLRAHSEALKEYEVLKLKLVRQEAYHKIIQGPFKGYTLEKDAFIKKTLDQAGFKGLCMRICTHHDEWEAARTFRQKTFFDNVPIADPYTWIFDHKDHAHLILYKGTKIIGYAHIQLWQEHRAALRIIVLDENVRGQGLGGHFLSQCERWLKQQGFKVLQTQASPAAYPFYLKYGYSEMPFNDPDGHESDPQDTDMGKVL